MYAQGAAPADGSAGAALLDWKMLINVVAQLSSLVLNLAPLPRINKLRQGRIVDTDLVPLLSILANGAIWTVYGVLTADSRSIWSNVPAVALGVPYVQIYRGHARPGLRGPWGKLVITAALILFVTFVALTASVERSTAFVGTVGAAVSVALMASPLANIRAVLRERSARSMSFPLSLFAFLTGFSWTLKGTIIDPDPVVWLPNSLGAVAASVQLFLFAKFRGGGKRGEKGRAGGARGQADLV